MSAIFVCSLFVLIFLGVPVAFSMGGASLLTMATTSSISWSTLLLNEVNGIASFTLLAIPLYMLAGKLMNVGGVTNRLFGFARTTVGWIPGGLGHVNVAASIIFAGMSGSAVADVSGLGVIEIKSMDEAGFDHYEACCITAASAMMGPIIPPSIIMVVYATVSKVSVGAMFLAGILPGLCMALCLMTLVTLKAIKYGWPRERFPSLKQIARATAKGFLPLMAPVIILMGIFTGVCTPTEAAAIVVIYAGFLGLFVYRELTFGTCWKLMKETALESAAIGMLIAGASLFGTVIVRAMIPQTVMELVTSNVGSKNAFILIVIACLLVCGMFMEASATITILTPILLPIAESFGINAVHFGMIMLMVIACGGLTPPVGITAMVTAKVGRVPFGTLCKYIMPWLLMLVIAAFLVAFIPAISLTLPTMAGLI